MISKYFLSFTFLFIASINLHQITACHIAKDIKNLLCTEITLYNSKTIEPLVACKDTCFRLPGIKLIESKKPDIINNHIRRHCKISIIPAELLAMYLVIKYAPKVYKYITKA